MNKIFKTRSEFSRGSEKGLAVFQLTRQVLNYISLYAMSHEMTKSKVIRDIVMDWYATKSRIDLTCTENLIKMIVKNLMKNYPVESFSKAEMKEFQNKIIAELEAKNIEPEQIAKIINEL